MVRWTPVLLNKARRGRVGDAPRGASRRVDPDRARAVVAAAYAPRAETWAAGDSQADDSCRQLVNAVRQRRDGGGNLYCVDADPSEGGRHGQVLFRDHEVGPQYVEASGMVGWLDDFGARLERGEMRVWRSGAVSGDPDPEA